MNPTKRALRRRATVSRIMMQPESFACRLNRLLVAFPTYIYNANPKQENPS